MIAGLLLAGIVVVGGGSVYAATRPTWTAPTTAISSTATAPDDDEGRLRDHGGPGTHGPGHSAIAARPKAQGSKATPKTDSIRATRPRIQGFDHLHGEIR